MIYALSETYCVEITGRLVLARLSHGPQTDTALVDRDSVRVTAMLERVSSEAPEVSGAVLDVRAATPALSLTAKQVFVALLRMLDRRGCRIAIVVCAQPQRSEWQGLVDEARALRAALFDEPAAARVFAARRRDLATESGEAPVNPELLTKPSPPSRKRTR